MKINMKIAAFIKTAREKKNLTQAELGRLVGVTDSAVSRWEKGELALTYHLRKKKALPEGRTQ